MGRRKRRVKWSTGNAIFMRVNPRFSLSCILGNHLIHTQSSHPSLPTMNRNGLSDVSIKTVIIVVVMYGLLFASKSFIPSEATLEQQYERMLLSHITTINLKANQGGVLSIEEQHACAWVEWSVATSLLKRLDDLTQKMTPPSPSSVLELRTENAAAQCRMYAELYGIQKLI